MSGVISFTALAMGVLLATAAGAAEDASPPVSNTAGAGAAAAQVPLEQFQEPRVKYIDRYHYPSAEIEREGEGWVNLGFMVDAKGKPFEITVVGSTGNKDFEKAAIRALQHSTFTPGTVNGKPMESASELKFTYRLDGGIYGARPEFSRAYRELVKAISASDRPAADAAMGELKVTNLYEDAFYGLARYYYAGKWGTPAEQRAGLERAIANERDAGYLSRQAFREALRALFLVDVKTLRYGEALDTWRELEKKHLDAKSMSQMNSIVEQLNMLKTDGRAYEITDVMPQGSWSLELFKRHFHVAVSSGRVSVIKLYCKKRFVSFAFDPTLDYEVKTRFGSCRMEMLGDAGTKFSVVQF